MRSFLSRLPGILFLPMLVFIASWYGLLIKGYIAPGGGVEGADFLTYYAVGQVAREHGLDRVYDLDLAAAAQAELLGIAVGDQQVLPPNHPPFLYPYLAFVAQWDYLTAYFLYALLMVCLLLLGLLPLLMVLGKEAWRFHHLLILSLAVLLFEPVFISLLKGQDSALLLLGGLLWLAGILRQDDLLSGLGLSLTLIRPQLALVLAIPFLFQQRRIFWWFLLGALVLGVYSFLQVGWEGALQYLDILTLSAGGRGYGLAESAMVNFTGLLLRLLPGMELELIHRLGWILYGLVIVVVSVVWRKTRSLQPAHLTLAVCLALFAAPHLHYHDLALLAVPLLGLGLSAVRSGRWPRTWAAVLPSLVSLLLIVGEIWIPVGYLVIYLLMVFLPILAFRWGWYKPVLADTSLG